MFIKTCKRVNGRLTKRLLKMHQLQKQKKATLNEEITEHSNHFC